VTTIWDCMSLRVMGTYFEAVRGRPTSGRRPDIFALWHHRDRDLDGTPRSSFSHSLPYFNTTTFFQTNLPSFIHHARRSVEICFVPSESALINHASAKFLGNAFCISIGVRIYQWMLLFTKSQGQSDSFSSAYHCRRCYCYEWRRSKRRSFPHPSYIPAT
jgi:hypothetical protein